MLIELPETAVNYVLKMYNKFWTSKHLPDSWKESIIVPIPKPNEDHSLATSYRPIALTSVICKTIECMVNERLFNSLESRRLLSKFQCGGRKFRSTLDHLVKLESVICKAFAKEEHVIAVSFDMEKAYIYDMTWKYGILRDLHDCGIGGRLAAFVENFLSDIFFRVKVNDTFSGVKVQENGIPQGSVVSPTLFTLKINEIIDLMITMRHSNLRIIGV